MVKSRCYSIHWSLAKLLLSVGWQCTSTVGEPLLWRRSQVRLCWGTGWDTGRFWRCWGATVASPLRSVGVGALVLAELAGGNVCEGQQLLVYWICDHVAWGATSWW